MRILSIIGTRPQVIKYWALKDTLTALADDTILIDTGQHQDPGISSNIYSELGFAANMNLENDLKDYDAQQDCVAMLRHIIKTWEPDTVLVFGDTRSTLIGSIAAKSMGVRLAHYEAGLRSFNKAMPEENIRIIVDTIADIHFAPTPEAWARLCQERAGVGVSSIYLPGDLAVDAIRKVKPKQSTGRAVMTIHRNYNKELLFKILRNVDALNIPIDFYCHPNTMAHTELKAMNIHFREPATFFQMVNAIRSAPFVITDSGTLQKESYILRKPCYTIRTETEWRETLKGGWNTIVSYDNVSVIGKVKPAAEDYQSDLFKPAADAIARILCPQ